MKITPIVIGMTIDRRLLARCALSNSPPQLTS